MQKTNNNIAGYHLVSRRVIATPLDVQIYDVCIDAQKGPSYFPKNMFQFQICYYSYLNVS